MKAAGRLIALAISCCLLALAVSGCSSASQNQSTGATSSAGTTQEASSEKAAQASESSSDEKASPVEQESAEEVAKSLVASDGKAVATVGTVSIGKSAVKSLVQEQRTVLGYDDDKAWKKHLKELGMTESSLFETYEDRCIRWATVVQLAKKNGVELSEEEFKASWNALVEETPDLDKKLKELGWTEKTYAKTYWMYLLEAKLSEALFPLDDYKGDESARKTERSSDFEKWLVEQQAALGITRN